MRKIISFFILFNSIAYSQKVRTEIDSVISQLVNPGMEYFDTDFEFKNISKFNELKEKATTKELIQLSKSKNSQIKALALITLVDLKDENLNQLFKKTLNNEAKIDIKEGCIISEESYAYLIYDRVSNQHYYNNLDTEDINYFNLKTKDFNRTIISHKKNYSLLSYALYNNNADVANYKKIRKLVLNEQNEAALLALAAYKNTKDIKGFISLKEKSFEAISIFNDEAFWDFLVTFKNIEKSENYFNAIASYKNESSNFLLTELFGNKENEAVIKSIFNAISKYYSPKYLELFKTIFQKKGYINVKMVQKLIENNSKEASSIFSQKLLSNDSINVLYDNYNGDELFEIYPLILSVIKENNTSELEEICINRIQLLDSFSMQAFLETAENENFLKTSAVILEKIKNKNTPYNYFHLSKTIFSFKNEKDVKKVLEILKHNEKDWNYGNWSDAFKVLFENYKVKIE